MTTSELFTTDGFEWREIVPNTYNAIYAGVEAQLTCFQTLGIACVVFTHVETDEELFCVEVRNTLKGESGKERLLWDALRQAEGVLEGLAQFAKNVRKSGKVNS